MLDGYMEPSGLDSRNRHASNKTMKTRMTKHMYTNIGAQRITSILIWGVPNYNYSIINGPQDRILVIKRLYIM